MENRVRARASRARGARDRSKEASLAGRDSLRVTKKGNEIKTICIPKVATDTKSVNQKGSS